MKQFFTAARHSAALSLALLVSACGGGGGGDTATPPPPSGPCAISIVSDTAVASGKTAAASALAACNDGTYIKSILWTKVSGPAIGVQTMRSPTLAMETSATGVIALRADAVLSNGVASSATTSITVGAAVSGSYLTLRSDHSLRVGSDTSVRAWPVLSAGETVRSIVWTQVAGPVVNMDTRDNRVLMFKVPAIVSADVALRFRATMTTSSNKVDTDDVIVSIDRQAATPQGYIFRNTARVYPFVAGGAFSNVLARCSYDVGLYYQGPSNTSLCTAATLPLLQADAGPGGTPTVEQVMARVLVSHDFLGTNFETFLRTQDTHGDFRRMLGAVSTIVIGSHVRPSFYQPATGAIYLDAAYLWLTPEQRDVVTEVPDYRLAFDDNLNYLSLGRVIKNGVRANQYYDPEARVTRLSSDLIFGLGRLLYHELAHAGDYFAPASRTLNNAVSIYANVETRADSKLLPSDDLARAYPLLSVEMKGLGQVMFLGATPTAIQRAYTAAQVGAFFESDVASDEYAYSIYDDTNSREDLAMLFEEFMMSYRHGVQYDVAYTGTTWNTDPVIGWGQRGRIGTTSIKPRVKLVVGKVAPWIDQAAIDALPAPVQMRVGSLWLDSGALNGPLNGEPQPAMLFRTQAEKAGQLRSDIAFRRHAH